MKKWGFSTILMMMCLFNLSVPFSWRKSSTFFWSQIFAICCFSYPLNLLLRTVILEFDYKKLNHVAICRQYNSGRFLYLDPIKLFLLFGAVLSQDILIDFPSINQSSFVIILSLNILKDF